MIQVLALSAGLGLLGVAVMTYLTWPANTLGNYLHDRRNREANIRALLDAALTQDGRDGSLGSDRDLALRLRSGLGPAKDGGTAVPR